jgi:hypothetical protein
MIKIFGSSSVVAENAANELNQQIEDWKKSFGNNSIDIINSHMVANNNGWILTVHYNILRY